MTAKLLERMRSGGLTLLVERQGRLAFASDRTGLRPLYRGVVEHPDLFEGAEVADRVVGLAAAYLLLQAKVARVSAGVMAREAERALAEAGIESEAETKVKALTDPPLQPDGIGLEQMAREAASPAHFLEALRAKLG